MDIKKKAIITSLISGAAVLLLFFGAVSPIFSRIKKESENLIAQRKELLESEDRAKNSRVFKINLKRYQPNLAKIDLLFVNVSEPVGFIEFLESEASQSRLSIEISPPASKDKANDSWPSLEFTVNIKGPFPNFLRFLDRLESVPYLVKVVNLSINKNPEVKNNIIAALSIKVYAK